MDTCGRTDANGVSKILVKASSPSGPISLYSVQFDTLRRLPITSTAMHNELNQVKNTDRKDDFRMNDCNKAKKQEMNCGKTFKLTPAQKAKSGYLAFDRGHLVPANPNRFSEDALQNTFYCTNIAPQDPYVNRGPWQYVESLSLDHFKKFPGFVMTGLCDEDSPDGVTQEGYVVPACYWKMVCYREKGTGQTQVVGFIANNALVNKNDQYEVNQRWRDVTTPRSQSEIEKVTRTSYIAKAWTDAAKYLLEGRDAVGVPDARSCIAAKKVSKETAVEWDNPKPQK